jgi:Mg2+-importing ATPase
MDNEYGVVDENRLTLVGLLTFFDPPKTSAATAIHALQAGGVAVKILTGDNERITLNVCQAIGLQAESVLLGSEIAELSRTDLAIAARKTTVFARLTPNDKERVVQALRDQQHVVGFLGDGINDAPALRAADVGISVNTAADIARDSADLVLLEKDLGVLETGMREGRRTFANMLKYIKLTASSNFGNVFSVLVASAFIPFMPILPLQLLLNNMLYDVSQTVMPFDHVDAESLQKPLKWNPRELGWFMVFFGPISSVFDIATFAVMWWIFGASSAAHATLFQSGWFVESLLSQTLIVHLLRTRKLPFMQSTASWPLLAMAGIVTLIGLVLPFSPYAGYFGLQTLPALFFPYLAGILLAYAALTQGLKGFYARRFGW